MRAKLNFFSYRLATVAKSLKALYSLPQERVEAFLNSYNIYDCDWIDDEQPDYTEIKKKLVDYYSVLNHLLALGQVEKMYIPPAMDLSRSIIANQALFEKKMSQDLRIGEGHKVLDIGCGRGRVAAHIASITRAQIQGMNLDPHQLEFARRFALGNGLDKQCQFTQGDLNDLPLPFVDQTFDALYQIQVFTYSRDLSKLFADLHRILKPGGRLACLDWVVLDAYDRKNPHHLSLMRRIKPLIAAIGNPSPEKFVNAMEKAGFKIRTNENASIDGLQAPLIENADKFFTRLQRAIHFLVRSKALPAHFKLLFDRLTKDGEAFVEADRLRLVTTSHYIVAEKI